MSTAVPDVNFFRGIFGRACLCNGRVRSRSRLRIAINASSTANVKAVQSIWLMSEIERGHLG